MEFGKKIRQLRKKQKLSIEQLAAKAELSSGLISQMERDLTTPSVGSLWKVAKALSVHINYFFDEYEQESPIVRKAERKKIILPHSSITYELLSPSLQKKMEFLMITIEPGQENFEEQICHDGEECGYMLQGTMKIKWGSREFVLAEGDSIYLDSAMPHRFINCGTVTAVSIWAMTPPSF
ncbi:MAG: XRE family transcriptional regulator [Sporomusaceae bacterium]|nr:XRE family transcriptional regulator [Sporomusaceae bacterium]